MFFGLEEVIVGPTAQHDLTFVGEDTRGVYLIREDILDMTAYRWYDISEYEIIAKSVKTDENLSSIDSQNVDNNAGTKDRLWIAETNNETEVQRSGNIKVADTRSDRIFKSPP